MALTGKLEAVVEIQSASDKFFSVLSTENHQVHDASSDKVHGVEVHEGDWKTTGSVKLWKYTVEGEVGL
ncbi:hypothetical protein FH972_027131 [Carpinus fangiana]|uniref:Bet v I/Major latex protein domain-containing protein n=1 Tax=Carpinus fangiana TaxID=176857 RepID=A0A5N6L632_9ROSI|nr:hypothetical protein FH972_027131 [Carpinus fangiana]